MPGTYSEPRCGAESAEDSAHRSTIYLGYLLSSSVVDESQCWGTESCQPHIRPDVSMAHGYGMSCQNLQNQAVGER